MPELHIFNIDETAQERNENLKKLFVKKTLKIFPRFLFCLLPRDKAVFPFEPDRDFLKYACGITGADIRDNPLLYVDYPAAGLPMCDAVLGDKKLVDKLKELAGRGFSVSFFMRTAKAAKLAFKCGFSKSLCKESSLSRALSANDKASFKELCSKAGVPFIEGFTAGSFKEAVKVIVKLPQSERFFLKKTVYGGGIGNICGYPGELLKKLPEFYSGGRLVIEPCLDAENVYGTLCRVSAEKSAYLAADRQKIRAGGWSGFDCGTGEIEEEGSLRSNSLKLAEKLRRLGFEGIANFDWLKEKNSGRLYAIEANLRNNGFYFLYSFALRYFETRKIHISYREGIKTSHKNFRLLKENLKNKLEKNGFKLIESGGYKNGFMIVSFSKGEFSLACFSSSKSEAGEMRLFMEEEFK